MASFWSFIFNFEFISRVVLVYLWLTLNMQMPTGRKKALKHTRNKKPFAAECIRKKRNNFLIILIRLLLLTVNYSGKDKTILFKQGKLRIRN